MTAKAKKSNPVTDIRNLERTIGDQIGQVEKTIQVFENTRDQLPEDRIKQIEPMVDTLRRDCKTYRGKVSRVIKSIEGIDRPKRVEQYMKVHQAGLDMFQTVEALSTATLPVVAEVIKDIEEGIEHGSK